MFNWKAAVGVVLSVALLVLALHDVDFAQVASEIGRADVPLFLAAVALATFVFVVRAWRWRPLLAPVRDDIPFRPRFAATAIGFMANNLLPARAGEFARAYALARVEKLPVTASLGSLVVERLLDAAAIVAFMFAAMTAPGFPSGLSLGTADLGTVAIWLLGIVAAVVVLLYVMARYPERAVKIVQGIAVRVLPRSFLRPVVDSLEAFLQGVSVLRDPALLTRAILWTVALWLINALSFWVGFLAFGLDLPFSAALFVQGVIGLAVALPSAPGFFGVFEYAARVGLVGVFGAEVNKAIGFAVGFHMGGFIPITLIGLYYVWRLGFSLGEVEQSEEKVEEAVERAADG